MSLALYNIAQQQLEIWFVIFFFFFSKRQNEAIIPDTTKQKRKSTPREKKDTFSTEAPCIRSLLEDANKSFNYSDFTLKHKSLWK